MTVRTTTCDCIEAILQNTGWSQAGLAWEIEVDQSTISKWLNGTRTPNANIIPLLRSLARITSEKALLQGWGTIAAASKWHFICARAKTNDDALRERVDMTLDLFKHAVHCAMRNQSHEFQMDRHRFLFSILAMSVPFPDKSQAFIFADDKERPERFIILVNDKLSTAQQRNEAMAEVLAHVRPYLFINKNAVLAENLLI